MYKNPAIAEDIRRKRREKTQQLMRDIKRWRKEKKAELKTAEKVEALQAFIEGK